MSVYSQAGKADRLKIRRQMIAQAEKLLPSHLRRTAKTIVDMALAKERHEQDDNGDTKRTASPRFR